MSANSRLDRNLGNGSRALTVRCFPSGSFITAASMLVVASMLLAAAAQANPEVAGQWVGEIEIPGQSLAVEVDLTQQEDQTWGGDISIPAQGAEDLPLVNVEIEERNVRFTIDSIPGDPTFTGEWTEAEDVLAGSFAQAGQSFPFRLERAGAEAGAAVTTLENAAEWIVPAMEVWSTPGIAVGVVVGGEVILAEGFGLRNTEKELPVTSQTIFAIGSSTKAFTTFALGTLVDEGELDWDEPVRTYIPEFEMHDEYATHHLRPRDMVTHRSGLPRHDLVWYGNSAASRQELVARLRYLEPNAELRERWQYNNLMYLAVGYLTEVLTGQTWEEVIRDRIFEPIGMSNSNLSVDVSQKSEDHSLPYIVEDDVARSVDFRSLDVVGPAGSINSCVDDMNRWMLCHLNEGRSGDEQVIEPSTLRELHTAQMGLADYPSEEGASPTSYAFGWFVDTWHGHYRLSHGGNIDGFSALVTLFPQEDVGIVVLSNRNGDPIPSLVSQTLASQVLGFEGKDWIGEAKDRRARTKEFREKGQENKGEMRVEGTQPSRSIDSFAGVYQHPGYGELTIETRDQRLVGLFNGMELPLEHWHYDVFNVAEVEDAVIPENLRLVFESNARGRIGGLSVSLEPQVDAIEFEKQASPRLSDPKYLARLVGEYKLPSGDNLSITTQGTSLFVSQAGNPPNELVPDGDDEFKLAGVEGFSLKFIVPDQGAATGLMAIQPNGVYELDRAED